MADRSSCLFFLVVFFSITTLQVQARESRVFFSKFTHLTTNENSGPSPIPAVSYEGNLSPAPSPAPVSLEAQKGAGHFGPGSGLIPQTEKSWPTTTNEIDPLTEELAKLDGDNYDINDENYEEEEKREGKYNTEYDGDKYYKKNDEYEQEGRQGLSDTRFLENGRYYYDVVKGEIYKYEPRSYVGEGGDVRGEENQNEFDTMEEYYKRMEGRDQQGKEEFVP